MHELSLVEDLVSKCSALAAGRMVVEVRARCASGIDPAELSDAFTLMRQSAGPYGDPCLNRAELKLEPLPVELRCGCGFAGQLSEDHMAGHMSVCPRCGQVGEVETGLELVGIKLPKATSQSRPPEGPKAPSPARAIWSSCWRQVRHSGGTTTASSSPSGARRPKRPANQERTSPSRRALGALSPPPGHR